MKKAKESVPKEEYRLCFTDEQCTKLKEGVVKLMTKKDGKLLANLVNTETGEIFQPVEIKNRVIKRLIK